jgi:hypothetical protein
MVCYPVSGYFRKNIVQGRTRRQLFQVEEELAFGTGRHGEAGESLFAEPNSLQLTGNGVECLAVHRNSPLD